MMMSHDIFSKDSCDPWYPHPTEFTLHLPICFHPNCFCQSQPPADKACPWLSSTDLATLAQPVVLITVEEMWRNVVEETVNRDPKEDNVPLRDNKGATHR